MEKAFDPKDLVEKLKAKGMDVAEDMAKLIAVEVMDWLGESFALSENKYDDLVLPLMPPIKAFVVSQLDKIDGKEG